jgi:hypothetical protein
MSKLHEADDPAVRKRHEGTTLNQKADILGQKTKAGNIKEEVPNTSGNSDEKISDNDNGKNQQNSENRSANARNQGSSLFYIPKRLIVTFMLGLGLLLVYAMRTNVGVMVVMILDDRAFEKVGTIDAKINVSYFYTIIPPYLH